MPAKINLYNLGVIGVDIVSSPLHSSDGAFSSAQNAISSPEDVEESLRKRPGTTRLNSSAALPASVIAIHNILVGT